MAFIRDSKRVALTAIAAALLSPQVQASQGGLQSDIALMSNLIGYTVNCTQVSENQCRHFLDKLSHIVKDPTKLDRIAGKAFGEILPSPASKDTHPASYFHFDPDKDRMLKVYVSTSLGADGIVEFLSTQPDRDSKFYREHVQKMNDLSGIFKNSDKNSAIARAGYQVSCSIIDTHRCHTGVKRLEALFENQEFVSSLPSKDFKAIVIGDQFFDTYSGSFCTGSRYGWLTPKVWLSANATEKQWRTHLSRQKSREDIEMNEDAMRKANSLEGSLRNRLKVRGLTEYVTSGKVNPTEYLKALENLTSIVDTSCFAVGRFKKLERIMIDSGKTQMKQFPGKRVFSVNHAASPEAMRKAFCELGKTSDPVGSLGESTSSSVSSH